MKCDNLKIQVNNDDWFDLSSVSSKLVWSSQAGFGMPPIERLTERGPFQHGVTNLGFRLQPRTINIAFTTINYGSVNSHILMRDKILRIFQPTDTVLKLRYTNALDQIRQIDCFYNGGLELDHDKTRDAMSKTYVVELMATDPTWYNPTLVTSSYYRVAITRLVFPFTVGANSYISFGGHFLDSIASITYPGSWLAYPTIEIRGPISYPRITNVTTDEEITLNHEIDSGETVTIDLSYGNKTVTSTTGENLIGSITPDSDLATFHIAPAYEAPLGVNTITCYGGNIDSNTRISFKYYVRYIGV